MQSKDLKSLLLKLNNYLVRNLDTATGLGINRSNYEITIDHLISCLIEDGQGDVPLILKHYNIDSGDVQAQALKNLEEMNKGNSGKPKLSPLLTELLERQIITISEVSTASSILVRQSCPGNNFFSSTQGSIHPSLARRPESSRTTGLSCDA